jgi:hypothetical protein
MLRIAVIGAASAGYQLRFLDVEAALSDLVAERGGLE